MSQMPIPPMTQNSGMMRPHRATMILVFGIVGLVLCLPFGIAAWIMANSDLRQMEMGGMDPAGRETTKVGKILGMIATGLACLGILLWVGLMFLGLMGAVAGAAGSHHP